MIRQFSTVNFPSKSWLVVGGGPCGIGVTGKLVDLGQQVAWIDPAFEVGRMGPYYRNVPANTPNGDLIKAFRLSPSFEFDELQLKRKLKGEVMSDLELDRCHSLSTFVDALEDATTVLKNKVHRIIQGGMKSIHLSENGKWRCFTDSNVTLEEVDAVVLTNGCHPRWLPPFPTVEHSQQPKRSIVKCNKTDDTKVVDFYSLDLMVDPLHCREQLSSLSRTSSKWAVVGNSHSGMLVVKNLIEAGFTNVVNFHRSPLKFMHTNERGVVKYPGTGLKGPVGEWVKQHATSKDIYAAAFRSIQQDKSSTWESLLVEHNIDHCVIAIGFDREDSVKIATWDGKQIGPSELDRYDGNSGEIKLGKRRICLFGTGIAFPKFHFDAENELDPWVGFRKSIEQTELMVNIVHCPP